MHESAPQNPRHPDHLDHLDRVDRSGDPSPHASVEGRQQTPDVSRRLILKSAGAASAGAGLGLGAAAAAASPAAAAVPRRQGATMIGVPFERRGTVRVGIVGLGNRGSAMTELFLAVPGVRVVALCDTVRAKAEKVAAKVRSAGQPAPALYTKGEDDFRQLCGRGDVDFVYVATPWEWHFPMAEAALTAGKHVGVECPAAMELDQLWRLVDLSERTRRHCIQLENCCYGRNEMRVLRMAHAGKFGELLHGAGAYIHDLRELMFSPTYYEGPWRRLWHTRLRGDVYPTHGFAPVANYMDVNRGDRAVRITTFGSPAAGLAAYRAQHMPPGDASWKETYVGSDMSVSLVQTARGRVIRLEHAVSNPHPYSRVNALGGTKGAFEDYPPRIYLEPEMSGDEWGDFGTYAEWDHWLWKEHANPPGGHGGMDYIMIFRLMQCMRQGLVPDFDVYDAATWSAPVPLSHASIRAKGAPQEIPDFTRGLWRAGRPGVDSAKP
ncbi:Gfo/Idh/MocA family protein [Streptomyces telluris]|uniref:Glycosyl hydrolase family 109 protein n=1 Tax=Streptomyces telluris TaxID=2720021 RepID=A0A9X2LNS4_9ACTN|nr:Gfo/Idh/MocA family oxidoreductase [Streptomyces telluris]MCQ8774623.1 Gfo/Idh/MocA family oxidoreductase [Streptomyces telluris]NJP78882.1 Gfo/Idh/MocA family oxidoreductase [Streptomyces telluris]